MKKVNARNAAAAALLKVNENTGYSNIVLDKTLKEVRLSAQDSAFCSALFYGVLEKRMLLDYIIGCYSSMPVKKMEPIVLEILRCGVYQLFFMDKVPDSAAVNEAVSSAKDFGAARASGFINGILRNILRKNKVYTLPKDENAAKSLLYSCPQWLIERLQKAYGEKTAQAFLDSLLVHPSVHIRVNTTKTTAQELIRLLKEESVLAEETGLLNALAAAGGNPAATKAFEEGLFHIQDLSSQTACSMIPLEKGNVVCDVCAAPGGKTFTIAENLNNQGKVFSFDLYKGKVGLIRKGAERLGLSCIEAAVRDAQKGEELPYSDVILCDVPCSGMGIIRRKPEIRYKNENELKDLPDLQYDILQKSAKSVKVGGYLMYSTCTLLPEENGMVVRKFLENNPQFVAHPLSLPLGMERELQEEKHEFTMFPHKNGTDGFFAALMKRVK